MAASLGEQFARALASKNAEQLLTLLRPDVDFRAMTPGNVWDAASAKEIVHDVFFDNWFESSDTIETVEQIETATIADTERVGYRFRVRNSDGHFLVEQQAYLRASGDQIGFLRIVCSGYRPVA